MPKRRNASRRVIKRSPFLRLLALITLICISMAATVYLIFLKPGTMPPAEKKPAAAANIAPKEIIPPPPPQLKEENTVPLPEAVVESEEIDQDGPKIAIIIDDIGDQRNIGEKFIDLDLNLNFSILPHSTYGMKLAKQAQEKGRDILLHLPMEPMDLKWDPGPGALLLKMDENTRRNTLLRALETVPMAIGINNHMGSRYSEDKDAMRAFLGEIKEKNLFFIDSLTSPKSIGYALAKEMGVKTARRSIFLDNEKEPEKITKQLDQLVLIAQKEGEAIGIGHPHPATLEALIAFIPRLQKEVILASIHTMVE